MRRFVGLALACVGAWIGLGASAFGAIAYLQNFSAASGQQNLSTVNWQAYYGSATTVATLAAPGSSGSPANAMISAGASAPTPGANVNATAAVSSTVNGFVPLLSNNGADQFVVYTTEYTIDGSLVNDFSWYSGSMYSGDSQRIIVQIGGNWYASTTSVTPVNPVNNGSSFGAAATQSTLTFSTAAANWDTLNFTAGSDLTLGSALSSSLPSGSITGFGLYAQIANHSDANERTYFDTFVVDSVPEPAAVGMLGAGGLVLLARRRREHGARV
jgi:hypothetical protein